MYNYGPCSMKCGKLEGFKTTGILEPGESLNYFVLEQAINNLSCVKFFTKSNIQPDESPLTLISEIIPEPDNFYDSPRDPYIFDQDDKIMFNIDYLNKETYDDVQDITSTLDTENLNYDPNTDEYVVVDTSEIYAKFYKDVIFNDTKILKFSISGNRSTRMEIDFNTNGIVIQYLISDDGISIKMLVTETTYVNKAFEKVEHAIIELAILKVDEYDPNFANHDAYIEYDLENNVFNLYHAQLDSDGNLLSEKTETLTSEYIMNADTFTMITRLLFNDVDNSDKVKAKLEYKGTIYPIQDPTIDPVDIKLQVPLNILHEYQQTTNINLQGVAWYDISSDNYQYHAYMPMLKYFVSWYDDENILQKSDYMELGSLQHMYEPFSKKYPYDYTRNMIYEFNNIRALIINKIQHVDNVEHNIRHEYIIDEFDNEVIISTNISSEPLLISMSDRTITFDEEKIRNCLMQKVRMTNIGSEFFANMFTKTDLYKIIGVNLYLYGDTDSVHNGGYVIDYDSTHDGEGLYPGYFLDFTNLQLFKTNITDDGDLYFQMLTKKLSTYTTFKDNIPLNLNGYELVAEYNGKIGAVARVFYKYSQVFNTHENIAMSFTVKLKG